VPFLGASLSPQWRRTGCVSTQGYIGFPGSPKGARWSSRVRPRPLLALGGALPWTIFSTFAADRIRRADPGSPDPRFRRSARLSPAAELDAIADVARWSGSSRTAPAVRFRAVVRQRDTIRRLAEPPCPRRERFQTATAAIAIVLRTRRGGLSPMPTTKAEPRSGSSSPASMLGLGAGITWILPEARDKIHSILAIPEGRFVRTIVAIGHRAKRRAHRSRPRARPAAARRGRVRGGLAERLNRPTAGLRPLGPTRRPRLSVPVPGHSERCESRPRRLLGVEVRPQRLFLEAEHGHKGDGRGHSAKPDRVGDGERESVVETVANGSLRAAGSAANASATEPPTEISWLGSNAARGRGGHGRGRCAGVTIAERIESQVRFSRRE